jgi:hypothetical protein
VIGIPLLFVAVTVAGHPGGNEGDTRQKTQRDTQLSHDNSP